MKQDWTSSKGYFHGVLCGERGTDLTGRVIAAADIMRRAIAPDDIVQITLTGSRAITPEAIATALTGKDRFVLVGYDRRGQYVGLNVEDSREHGLAFTALLDISHEAMTPTDSVRLFHEMCLTFDTAELAFLTHGPLLQRTASRLALNAQQEDDSGLPALRPAPHRRSLFGREYLRPYYLGWINVWSPRVGESVGFPDEAPSELRGLASRLPDQRWWLQLGAAPPDPAEPETMQEILRAYAGLPKIGWRK